MSLLCSCHSLESDGKRLQATLLRQMELSDTLMTVLEAQLSGRNVDSILLATKNESNILFYVFDSQRMVFWSNNWLAGSDVVLDRYDAWFYKRFDNAHCVCRWRRSGFYNILSVVPVKYSYKIENEQLRNTFISPFSLPDIYDVVSARQEQSYAVVSDKGTYLFSLTKSEKKTYSEQGHERLSDSFSYRSLLDPATDPSVRSEDNPVRWRLFLIMNLLLFGFALLVGAIGIIRHHGFRSMRLRTKLMYVFATIMLFTYAYVFVMSIRYVREHYELRQRDGLSRRAQYIQKALQLQDAYYWNVALSDYNSGTLNIDLRDLSLTYQTDIHVYDLNGNLVGTSAPSLFDNGLISRHLSAEVFFAADPTMLRDEQIGDMKYLCAYTEFVNGNYMRIGYIAVPLYLSEDEVNDEVDNFLSKLFVPYLLVILLVVVFSMLFARYLTRPLDTLSEKMRHFEIGGKNNHLDYVNQDDEIGELVARYNQMVDELEASADRLARSEREGAWRTMARQIAHEINNPLTPMKLTIQQLQRTKGTERFDDYFARSTNLLIEQIDNLSRIASSFSQFAKMPEVITTDIDVAQKLFSVISLFRSNNDADLRYVGPESGVMARADGEQIAQVFNNLIKNAQQAVEQKTDGNIIVMLKPFVNQTNSKQMVEISVSDNGDGIAPEVQEKIFMPNFTTKSTGMGLGLAISKNIVEGSGGTISFETSEKGTVFYVRLYMV